MTGDWFQVHMLPDSFSIWNINCVPHKDLYQILVKYVPWAVRQLELQQHPKVVFPPLGYCSVALHARGYMHIHPFAK